MGDDLVRSRDLEDLSIGETLDNVCWLESLDNGASK